MRELTEKRIKIRRSGFLGGRGGRGERFREKRRDRELWELANQEVDRTMGNTRAYDERRK